MNIPGITSGAQPWAVTGASMSQPPHMKMGQLFDQIDATGSGSITQAQFAQAFQTMHPPANFQAMGSDQVWAKLDPKGTGSVSKQDFVSTMKPLMRSRHHPRAPQSPDPQSGLTADAATDALHALGAPTASPGGTINLLS